MFRLRACGHPGRVSVLFGSPTPEVFEKRPIFSLLEKGTMKTTRANRRKQSNRRSGFERRWITSAYSGPERRKGADRRSGRQRRREDSRIAALDKPLADAADRPLPEEAPGASQKQRPEPGRPVAIRRQMSPQSGETAGREKDSGERRT